MAEKPLNILWICSDQQRWDTLGCYGNRFVTTPNLDRLASTGTVFDHAYTQSPLCTPSRACFLTGRYPRTTRCRQNGQDIPETEILVTRLLAEAGYTCGLSGKLHLSACNPTACKTIERRINDGYSEFYWSHHPPDDWQGYNQYALWLRENGQPYETPKHPRSPHINVGMPEEWHQTTWCTERAINFVRHHGNDDQPWLFSLNLFDPHSPFDPPVEYLQKYEAILDQIPLPNYREGELAEKTSYQRFDHKGAYGQTGGFSYDTMTALDHRLVRAAYWAMCDLIDAQVGRLLQALEESGQADDTLVIYMSDHGEMLGDHGIYLKGPFFYEPAIRVPLIVSCPDRVTKQRSSALVELADLTQTILDAVGLPSHSGMQGKSIWPLLTGTGNAAHHRNDVYCEYYNAGKGHNAPNPHLTMVRTRTHKLVVNHSENDGELYDLQTDPRETRNLWNDSGSQTIRADLLLRLCNRMAWTVDPLPVRRAQW